MSMTITEDQINRFLIDEDIEGFIELGAPTDEYESEAEVIAQTLADLPDGEYSYENVVSIISLIWGKYFNIYDNELKLRMPGIERVAKQIIAANNP